MDAARWTSVVGACEATVADDDVIDATQAGDARAFEQLYRRYVDDIRALCARSLRDPYAAEDIAQETFLRAFRRLGNFEQGRPVWPWLATIARNLCIDELRGLTRRTALDALATPEADRRVDVTAEEALDRVERQRLKHVVARALAGLRPRDRRVFVLQSLMGLSLEEIARAHKMSVHAVRNLAWRARRTLRNSLRGERAWGWLVALRFPLRRKASSSSRLEWNGVLVERVATIVLGFAIAGAAVLVHDPDASGRTPVVTDQSVRGGATPRPGAARQGGAGSRITRQHHVRPASLMRVNVAIGPPKDHAAAPSGVTSHVEVNGPEGETLVWYDTDTACGGQGRTLLPPGGQVAVVC